MVITIQGGRPSEFRKQDSGENKCGLVIFKDKEQGQVLLERVLLFLSKIMWCQHLSSSIQDQRLGEGREDLPVKSLASRVHFLFLTR